MGKKKKGGAVGVFPEEALEWKHPIKEGRIYRVSPLGGGLPLFDPNTQGLQGLQRNLGDTMIEPGDTFLAVERASNEVWLVLCKGVLGKVLLSEWALREVMEVTE
jgi:hypothetical protein